MTQIWIFGKSDVWLDLPSLFDERVRTRLNLYNGTAPYTQFTFGKLIKDVVLEGLALCSDLNL